MTPHPCFYSFPGQSWVLCTKTIESARMPLIKVVSTDAINIDITLDNGTHRKPKYNDKWSIDDDWLVFFILLFGT
jgi:hypothetical protein